MLDREGVYGLATYGSHSPEEAPTSWADSDIARSVSGSLRRAKERWKKRLSKISSRFVPDAAPEKRVVYLNEDEKNAGFAKNYVSTTKYSVLSFFPMFLYLQFSRPANFYFLVVGILQTFDLFSLVTGFGRYGVVLTLGIMLTISCVREAIEDLKRYRQDRKVNRAQTQVLGQSGKVRWGNVRVGEILKVHAKEFIPADMLLLSCSSLDGVVFVETKNLDGETNLKRKSCLAPLAPYSGSEEALMNLKGTLECEAPNDRIYQFSGTLEVSVGDESQTLRLAATTDSLLVRGSSLRNTEFCYGLVVYAGGDTKLMQNMRDPPKKISTLEKSANRWLIVPWCWQLFCTSLFSGLGASSCDSAQPWYLSGDSEIGCSSLDKFALFVRYWIVFAGFVPIGLYVTMELVRVTQTVFIHSDWKMYYAPLDVWTSVRTTGLNEELGVIDYIFSDKTGTLTANEMVFKKCFVDGVVFSTEAERDKEVYEADCEVYSIAAMRDAMLAEQMSGYNHKIAGNGTAAALARKQSNTSSQSSGSTSPATKTNSASSAQNQQRPSSASAQAALLFFHLLGLCHTVVPESSIQQEEDAQRKALSPRARLEKLGAAMSPRKRASAAAAQLQATTVQGEAEESLHKDDAPAVPSEHGEEHFLTHSDADSSSDPAPHVNGNEKIVAEEFAKHSSTASDKNAVIETLGNEPVYQATSPDEAALVLAAYHAGLEFVSRSSSAMVLKTFGVGEEWEVLGVIEFTSLRKRMSVILREKASSLASGAGNPLRVYTKGADNVIFDRLADGQEGEVQKMTQILDSFAAEGLRTLVMGYAEIDEEFFADWLDQYTTAQGLLGAEREQAMATVEDQLERNLTLLGASAIEDKLQELVPEALRKFAMAGIKTWVATGDKQETAINIGLSCGILDADMDVVVINETSAEDAEAQIDRTLGRWTALRQLQGHSIIPGTNVSESVSGDQGEKGKKRKRKSALRKAALEFVRAAKIALSVFQIFPGCLGDCGTGRAKKHGRYAQNGHKSDSLEEAIEGRLDHSNVVETHITSFGLVVDGSTLQYVLDSDLSEKFMVLAKMARAVITCRVSPKQKADLVRLVRKYDPLKVSLAIGDGANDVGMIQAAHVGIGLYGKEGVEAVLASDFAIGRFHYLTRLILVHGRWSFKRMSKMSMAVIYKSIFWVMQDFWMGWFLQFSSQPLVDPLLAGLYNVFLSFLPAFMLGVWDYDVPQDYALMFPEIYRKGHARTASRYGVFVSWFIAAIWHSALVFFSVRATFALPASASMNQGLDTGLFGMGFVIVGAVIFVQHCYFALFVGAWTWFFLALYLVSFTAYFYAGIIFCLPSVSAAISPDADGIAQFLWQQPKLYLVWFILPVIACLPYFTYRFLKKNFNPSLKHYVNELARRGIRLQDILPDEETERQLSRKPEKSKKPNITRRGLDFAYSGYNFEADDTGAMLRTAFRPDYRRIQMRHLKRSGSDTELDVMGVKSKGMVSMETKHRRARSDAATLRNARYGGAQEPAEVVTDAQIKAAIMAVEAGYRPDFGGGTGGNAVGVDQAGGRGELRFNVGGENADNNLVAGLKDTNNRRRRAPPPGERKVQFGGSAEAP
ncbi:putative phospholipid-transporting ATPase VA [Porphyridium purpureum]|uniref:Putative phospholipid-transporting ATPase VA n=1 Tax=Porphyridium purpureum TaxID=35688 RepID=A0A5J4Z0P4_PORPP|nr:putative phospholipid-transporting ATPase VA [Porphyridium purpureum]|eukprot:POR1992..scf208_2